MKTLHRSAALCVLVCLVACGSPTTVKEEADAVAAYARATYGEELASLLADLVVFRTVHEEGIANADHPEFMAMTAYLEAKAGELGLEFEDHGAVVVVALGDSEQRLGIITHGDVQPADPTFWAADPFVLDVMSEPGRLVGRGSEDDKGPIAAALFAMAAVRDRGLSLERRIELIISYTEESDWQPFRDFLAANPPPPLNVAIDAEYPVVTGEKGWCTVEFVLPPGPESESSRPSLSSFSGGNFISQVPGEAEAVVVRPSAELEAALLTAAEAIDGVIFDLQRTDGVLVIGAKGLSAHSSKPWIGKNAITHLAALLGSVEWPDSQAARMVRLINDLVGLGHFAERFGEVGYAHPFMGRLTLSLGLVNRQDDGGLIAGINLRRPAGRTKQAVEDSIYMAVAAWRERTGVEELELISKIYEPYFVEDAPHIPVLLDIFRRHTGRQEAEVIAIGGGSHARLVPTGVNFGPSMPGEDYTGHSEHEFITEEQLLLNLEMYTAMLVELTR